MLQVKILVEHLMERHAIFSRELEYRIMLIMRGNKLLKVGLVVMFGARLA